MVACTQLVTSSLCRYCELNVVGDRTVALAPMYDLPNHQPWTKTTFSYSAKLDMLQVVSGHRSATRSTLASHNALIFSLDCIEL